jgi:hypothetical protein
VYPLFLFIGHSVRTLGVKRQHWLDSVESYKRNYWAVHRVAESNVVCALKM